jgi:tyrosyl-tRNA synthetase
LIAKDSVRSRIESEHGISYTEFSYMLLQANDFPQLYDIHDVELQAGRVRINAGKHRRRRPN